MKPERWQQLEHLYQAALERESGERSAFLIEACPDDPALRSEVEMLLAANDQAGGFMLYPVLELEAKNLAAETPAPLSEVQIGQEMSRYRVLSRIGAGGMGEVFLAEDRALERRVALKLLPVQFTQNTERLQRFIREAKAASALNHPNIITIYEIGEIAFAQGRTHFIATEFIEGETLRAWKVDDEKRVRQSLNVATQVASALGAAHKAGIVHRDIKPENIMVRPDGLVKVLDFGLAKLTTGQTANVDPEARTMIQAVKTSPGLILGTLRYMSPEQARGRDVDARSDIFSLGVVLYELLTGQPLFAGDTDADIVAGIIHKQAPPLAEHLTEVPAELERIVQKALAKDKEQRYQNARDLQIDLESLRQESELSARLTQFSSTTSVKLARQTSSVIATPRFSVKHLLIGLPVLLLIAGLVWWLTLSRRTTVNTPPPASLTNVEVVRWASQPGEANSAGAFSPDGRWIAFVSSKSGHRNIWVRKTLSGEDHQSTKDEFNNGSPIWSPTGEEIAFFSLKRGGHPGIWRMPMLGGALVQLKPFSDNEGRTRLLNWSKDGATIYYESNRQIFSLDVGSGQSTQLTSFDQPQIRGSSLSISTDEKQIAYITAEPDGRRGLWFMPARGGTPKRIVDTAAECTNLIWHPDGERLFYSSSVEGVYQIFVADVEGRQPAQITFSQQDSFVVDVSSDGTKVLYGASEENSNIWGVSLAKAGDEQVVASDISSEFWPDISRDGKTVVYQAVRNISQGSSLTKGEILRKSVGEKAEPFVLVKEGFLPIWSPDGRQVAFLREEKKSVSLKTINSDGGPEKTLVTDGLRPSNTLDLPYNRVDASDFSWSPDSTKLAYCSIKDGVYNLRIVSADGSGEPVQITDNQDANLLLYCPVWSRDGKLIAYQTRPLKSPTVKDSAYGFLVVEPDKKTAKLIAQMNTGNRLLGWAESDQDLLFARYHGDGQKTSLWRLSIATGKESLVLELPPENLPANFYNIQISPDRRMIAYVAHQDLKDNIWMIGVEGGAPTKLTANNDPQLYFSTITWSPDSRVIYYGKQSRFSLLSMIANFK